jgi:uncharacterized protein DUF1579
MEMPKPTDAHKKLELLVGTWEGEEIMHPSPWTPEGGTRMGRVMNRRALDGFNVIQEYEQIDQGKTTFLGHGVFGYNTKESCYMMYWWDNFGGEGSQFRGNFEGKVLTVANQNEMGHSRAMFDLREPGVYAFKMDMSQDGKTWATLMEGKYRKKG